MKRTLLLLPSLVVLLLSSCKAFGPTGNPDDLTGTWNAVVAAFSSQVPLKVTQLTSPGTDFEGTWELTQVSGPAQPTVQVDSTVSPAVTTTTHVANETIITTTTNRLVVTADGSAVLTTTVALVQAARAAIAAVGTGTSQTNGSLAIVAGSRTVTTVTTATVTDVNGTGRYQEVRQFTQSAVASGTDYVGAGLLLSVDAGAYTAAITLSATPQSISRTVTSIEVAKGSLYYNTASSGLTHTVQGTTPTASYQNQVDTTYALVIAKEGTFTQTVTETTTQTARDAIAGTATVAPSPAVLVGTTVVTTVYAGIVSSSAFDGGKFVNFVYDSVDVTQSGTGALISPTYPETAVASMGDDTPAVYEYSIVEGSTDTWLTLQTSDTYTGTTYLVFLMAP